MLRFGLLSFRNVAIIISLLVVCVGAVVDVVTKCIRILLKGYYTIFIFNAVFTL